MQERQKWTSSTDNLRVGDLVLLMDKGAARGNWAKGIVQEAERGGDGRVREAVVRTTKGLLRRDVRQLCMLEASDEAIPVDTLGGV